MSKLMMACSLVLALGGAACYERPAPTVPQTTQGAEGTLGETSPTGVQPPPCPGDTVAQVESLPDNAQPRCMDVLSD